jgi:serine/threonine-protein kinase
MEPEARFCGSCGTLAGGASPSGAHDTWLGRVVDHRYRVVARLGAGGMGVVYRVEHLHFGKTAAMKVLAPDSAARPEMVRRFRNEAQAVSKLDHPNIVQTFDFGQAEGALYLVMEYINGEDLAALIRREGPWTFARSARLFTQVCSGLVDAHELGIVHRDLKPENLMVVRRRDGAEHVKVLDFGLAKLRERATDSGASAASSSGQVIGTPYYMAPEQVRGEPLDARADIYSVGASLYRVLTGVPPFDAPSPMGVLAKHITDPVIPPRRRAPERALPPEADRIVLRAMAKAPADRYASASEMREDLERALLEISGGPFVSSTTAPPPAPPGAGDAIPSGRADAPTVPIGDADIVDGMADRLRRSDIDEYEWGLRRRRWTMRILAPLLAAGAIAGGAALWSRYGSERADTIEHEPNNTPGYANLLALGQPVRGTIGKIGADGQGDVDYFRIPAAKTARAVDARLEGVPDVDLVLELYDGQGRLVAKSDERGRGWGEWLQPTLIGPAESYLAVREFWQQGEKPTEDAPDPYTLTVHWGKPQSGWEVEPNDWPAAATPLAVPGRVRGYLGRADDQDWFALTVTRAGTITASVTVPAGVDVVVLRDANGTRPVDKRGPGESEEVTLDAKPGAAVLIGIARKPQPGASGKYQPLQGLDDPYELKVDLAP